MAGGPRAPCDSNRLCAQSSNTLPSQALRGLFCGRSPSTPRPKAGSRTLCGHFANHRSSRTLCVRTLLAGYLARDPRAPCDPKQFLNAVCEHPAFAYCSRTIWHAIPDHPATQNSFLAQFAKSLCSQTLRRLSGGRPRAPCDPQHVLNAVCEQPAFADASRTIRRTTPEHPATHNRFKTQFANSLRSQSARGPFSTRRPSTLRTTTGLRRSLRTLCVRVLPADCLAHDPRAPCDPKQVLNAVF